MRCNVANARAVNCIFLDISAASYQSLSFSSKCLPTSMLSVKRRKPMARLTGKSLPHPITTRADLTSPPPQVTTLGHPRVDQITPHHSPLPQLSRAKFCSSLDFQRRQCLSQNSLLKAQPQFITISHNLASLDSHTPPPSPCTWLSRSIIRPTRQHYPRPRCMKF